MKRCSGLLRAAKRLTARRCVAKIAEPFPTFQALSDDLKIIYLLFTLEETNTCMIRIKIVKNATTSHLKSNHAATQQKKRC